MVDRQEDSRFWLWVGRLADLRAVAAPFLLVALAITALMVLALWAVWDKLWIGLLAAPFLFAATEIGLAHRQGRLHGPGVQILLAHYGAQGRHNDVTRIVRDHVVNGRLRIHVNNALLGPDPIVNVPKHLWIKYRIGPHGEDQEIEFPESDPNDRSPVLHTLP